VNQPQVSRRRWQVLSQPFAILGDMLWTIALAKSEIHRCENTFTHTTHPIAAQHHVALGQSGRLRASLRLMQGKSEIPCRA
jgi:hypothetical protein